MRESHRKNTALRWFLHLIGGVFVIAIVYALCAVTLPHIIVNTSRQAPQLNEQTVDIYIHSNGVHTDIVVPTKTQQYNWFAEFPPSTFESVDTTFGYLSIGWGDKGFYLDTPTWNDLKFSTALYAAIGLSTSAMHLTYHQTMTESATCVRKTITSNEYQSLITFIHQSFKTIDGIPERIDHPGYDLTDNFYSARGRYSIFTTCNCWTAQALKATGLPVGIWTPLESGVLSSIQ